MMPTEEDALDLYQNSALGLYEGELEPGNRDNSPSTSEEEDQFDDDNADMDDLDDGTMLGGSDFSDALDEEVGNTIVMLVPLFYCLNLFRPQSLDNANDLDKEARNLMIFLNSGAPDLGLPEGDSHIINAGGARGEIEDNLEDEDGGSVADRAHAGDNGFEGSSLDFGDEVVINTGIQTAPVDLGGHHTLLFKFITSFFFFKKKNLTQIKPQITYLVNSRWESLPTLFWSKTPAGLPVVKVSLALIVGWNFDMDPSTSGSLPSKMFLEEGLARLLSIFMAQLHTVSGQFTLIWFKVRMDPRLHSRTNQFPLLANLIGTWLINECWQNFNDATSHASKMVQ
ncbi:uncharacterized protein VP01_6114g2 [Puccinia sorghi]|uniref:Uncharacterized protein n=1 Tax=Puccinia sorghi TaxID=27349 RepID=A0A0L6UGZ5_9BASI|nr:uncharacterized protein VP01_6114g2 [Puccinia sorghi]